jgi:hypothetical protein
VSRLNFAFLELHESDDISRVGDAIGRLQFDVIRSRVIRQDSPRRSPAAAFRGARQSPAAWPEWSQRNGPAADRHGASPSGAASFGHCNRADRRSRPARRRSKPCPDERVARRKGKAGLRSRRANAPTKLATFVTPILRRNFGQTDATLRL